MNLNPPEQAGSPHTVCVVCWLQKYLPQAGLLHFPLWNPCFLRVLTGKNFSGCELALARTSFLIAFASIVVKEQGLV